MMENIFKARTLWSPPKEAPVYTYTKGKPYIYSFLWWARGKFYITVFNNTVFHSEHYSTFSKRFALRKCSIQSLDRWDAAN